ncbi:MAG TPA: LCP family protein [Candidatus Saccharimonadales bacterium]|nr:LCP family protein [Candidatus Saccharimonadales bacterium]
MHEFRSNKKPVSRQAVDGFLHAPQRPLAAHPKIATGRRSLHVGSAQRFAPRPHLDDFVHARQSHAVHPRAVNVAPAAQPIPTPVAQKAAKPLPKAAASSSSLLHMTLPGGSIETEKKKLSRREKRKHAVKRSRGRSVLIWTRRSALVMVALVLLTGGLLFTKGFFKAQKVFKGGGRAAALQENVTPALLKGEGSGRINILLFGKGGGDHEGPDLTDTILLVSINPVDKTESMLSIPRDLWVTPPGFGAMKINAVYANEKYHDLAINSKNTDKAESDGIALAEQEVSTILGIPINYYGMIDFAAFQQAVDTVGGVDITVPAEDAVTDYMYNEDTHKPYTLNVTAGPQHFDGLRALMYVRSRHTSARGDFDRTERQRLFIQALTQKILTAGTYTNPLKISQLMSAFGDNVSTDFSISDMLRLAQIIKGISNIQSIGLADPPNNYVVTDTVDNLSIVRPTAGIGNYADIQNFVRNTLKDPYIAKENAAIEVLNGTVTPGLATDKGNALKSYGYNVVKVDNAPTSDYTKTVLVDLSGGKKPFTKHYLEDRYGVKAVTKLPDSTIQATGADFVVILGQDETTASQN